MLLIFLFLSQDVLGDSSIGCFVYGICAHSAIIDVVDGAEDAQKCQKLCSEREEDCGFFTFWQTFKTCIMYPTCEKFEAHTEGCPDCLSGEVGCDCFADAACSKAEGDQEEVGTGSVLGCLDSCKRSDSCLVFSYEVTGDVCLKLEECKGLNSSARDSIMGSKYCDSEEFVTTTTTVPTTKVPTIPSTGSTEFSTISNHGLL